MTHQINEHATHHLLAAYTAATETTRAEAMEKVTAIIQKGENQ